MVAFGLCDASGRRLERFNGVFSGMFRGNKRALMARFFGSLKVKKQFGAFHAWVGFFGASSLVRTEMVEIGCSSKFRNF